MIVPFKWSISHTEIDFCQLFCIAIVSILRNFHCSIEMFCTWIIVSFLSEDFTKLHVCTTLSFSIFKFIAEFKITFNKHLHFILIHLRIYFISTNFTKVTNGNWLTSNWTHLNSVSKSELMIYWWFFIITNLVINDTQVNMSQEFTSNICDFFMFHMVLNSVIIIDGFNFSQFHEINTYTIVSKCFTMYITNCSTYLQKLLVLFNSFLKLSKVIK